MRLGGVLTLHLFNFGVGDSVLALLDDIISLKGLVSISIGALITIKTLNINFSQKSNNISVNGNNNNINIAPNPANQGSYKLLWNMTTTFVALTYPFWGHEYNYFLDTIAFTSVLASGVGIYISYKRFGLSGFFSVFYLATAIAVFWLTLAAKPFLNFTADRAEKLPDVIVDTWDYALAPRGYYVTVLDKLTTLSANLVTVMTTCVSIVGFSSLFLGAIYLAFGSRVQRTFDDAVRYAIGFTVTSAIGYVFCCNVILAMTVKDWAYISRVFENLINLVS